MRDQPPFTPSEAIVSEHKRPSKRPSAKAPTTCPQCGGRLRIHYGKAACVVPGCGWTGQSSG